MNWTRFEETAFYRKHKYRLMRANEWLSFFSAIGLILFLTGDLSHRDLARRHLAAEIKMTAILTGFHTGYYEVDPRVMRAMAQVPRHHFLMRPYNRLAYYNVALPFDGPDRLMAEPFLSAMMISLLRLQPADRVLEIGFASGFDAAVISRIAHDVYSIQQHEALRPRPADFKPAENEGFANVRSRHGDGLKGWPEAGPFDAILLRQSMAAPPPSLLEQLKPGGRLVMPVGRAGDQQRLTVFTRTPAGIKSEQTLYVGIPPLLAGHEI